MNSAELINILNVASRVTLDETRNKKKNDKQKQRREKRCGERSAGRI